MPENLLIGVMGNRNSGKSTTWNRLFGATVRTGRELRRLPISETEYVHVFLVSGSAEERHTYVGELMAVERPRIVLCSFQYREGVTDSYRYFFDRDYAAFIHWLNPGYTDGDHHQADQLELIPWLLAQPAMIGIRDGRVNPENRVQELREVVGGWAAPRGLLQRS